MRINQSPIFLFALLMIAYAGMFAISPAHAQEADAPKTEAEVPETGQVDDWYYRSPGAVVPKKSVAQQRAEFRGQQRMFRLASQRWYGYSNARPTVAAMPFTAMYRSAWQRPGGWPYHWSRPIVVMVR
jgi:hypothetical protein